MKKILIGVGIVGLLLILSFGVYIFLGKNLAGGGGSEQYAPDTIKTGKVAVIKLYVSAWGGGGPIKGRYTNLSLHYKLVGENIYNNVQPQSVALPDNYQKVVSKTNQWEAYEFSIPPYPNGTAGEIEYYIDLTFDGYPSRQNGIKKIKLIAPIAVADLCFTEKDKIIDLINFFENAQMKRESGAAESVLALFTPPELPDDSSTYVHLSGSDAAGPRLYSNGQTDFKQPSFKILENPTKNVSGSCTTKVQEQRSYYPHGVGGDFGTVQPYSVYFVTVKQSNAWKIDSYLSDSGSTHKYSGWGY